MILADYMKTKSYKTYQSNGNYDYASTKEGHGIGTYQCFCREFGHFPDNKDICSMYLRDYDSSLRIYTPLISITTLVLNIIIASIMVAMVKKIGYKT